MNKRTVNEREANDDQGTQPDHRHRFSSLNDETNGLALDGGQTFVSCPPVPLNGNQLIPPFSIPAPAPIIINNNNMLFQQQQHNLHFQAAALNQAIINATVNAAPSIPNNVAAVAPTMRFPCKARGIDSRHNEENAFLEVSPHANHGAVLVCSHAMCAASGRRFRWCAVCKIPVAKRNFMKRHSHGLITSQRYAGFPAHNNNNNSSSIDPNDIAASPSAPKKQKKENHDESTVVLFPSSQP